MGPWSHPHKCMTTHPARGPDGLAARISNTITTTTSTYMGCAITQLYTVVSLPTGCSSSSTNCCTGADLGVVAPHKCSKISGFSLDKPAIRHHCTVPSGSTQGFEQGLDGHGEGADQRHTLHSATAMHYSCCYLFDPQRQAPCLETGQAVYR